MVKLLWMVNLEVKCSEEYKNIDPKVICFISKNPPFLFSETSCKILVNKSHTYYDQIHMQLALTIQSWCDFIFYTSKGLIIHRVQFDEADLRKLQTKTMNFYFECMLDKLISCQSSWKVLEYWKIFSNNPFYVTDLSPPEKNQKTRGFLVFSGGIIKNQGGKWTNKISSLHLKVAQKVPGIFLNFYTELAFELGQDLLFLRTSTVLISSLE